MRTGGCYGNGRFLSGQTDSDLRRVRRTRAGAGAAAGIARGGAAVSVRPEGGSAAGAGGGAPGERDRSGNPAVRRDRPDGAVRVHRPGRGSGAGRRVHRLRCRARKKRRRAGGAGGYRPVSGGEYGGAGGGHGPSLPVLGTDGRRPFPFRGDLAGGAPAASVRSGVRRIKGRAECLRRGAPGPAPRVRHGAHAGHAGLLRQSHGAARPRAEVVRPLCGGGGGKNAGRHRPGPGAVHFPAGAPRNHSPGAGASAAARPVGHGAFCLRDAAGRAPET